MPGANRSISASQLPSRDAGQTTRVGRARSGCAFETVQVEGDQGDGLAQPHVVGEAGPETQRGELVEPGEPVPLVVAQRRPQSPGRGDRLAGGGREQPLADPEQAGPDHHLLVGLVHLDGAGQRGRDRLDGGDGADQPLLRLASDRGIDDGPGAAQLEDRARGGGEGPHLGVVEGLAVQRHLPPEREHRLGAERARHQRVLAVRAVPAVLEGGPRGEVPPQAPRPQHVHPRPPQGRDTVVEQRDQLVGVEGDLVGHPELEQPVQHRPRMRRRAQRDGRVHARPVVEAVVLGRAGPQQRRVAEVERIELVVDLQHQADRPGDQLLLVGLDPQRDGHQRRQPGGRPAGTGQLRLQPAPEPGARTGGRAGRRPPRQGVDDRGHQVADLGLRPVGRPPVVRRLRGQPAQPLVLRRLERPGQPAAVAGLEPARADEAQRQHAGLGEGRHAGVRAATLARPGQHGQRLADGQRDRAHPVGELHRRVPRRVGGTHRSRSVDGDAVRAHPGDGNRVR